VFECCAPGSSDPDCARQSAAQDRPSFLQKPVAVLREGRVIPGRIINPKAYEPADPAQTVCYEC